MPDNTPPIASKHINIYNTNLVSCAGKSEFGNCVKQITPCVTETLEKYLPLYCLHCDRRNWETICICKVNCFVSINSALAHTMCLISLLFLL